MYITKALKRWFSTAIHICGQNNSICYAFEGHINVGCGPHLALGPPLRHGPDIENLQFTYYNNIMNSSIVAVDYFTIQIIFYFIETL